MTRNPVRRARSPMRACSRRAAPPPPPILTGSSEAPTTAMARGARSACRAGSTVGRCAAVTVQEYSAGAYDRLDSIMRRDPRFVLLVAVTAVAILGLGVGLAAEVGRPYPGFFLAVDYRVFPVEPAARPARLGPLGPLGGVVAPP